MKLKKKSTFVVDVSDWDDFITEVYGRPYSFQQQDGCKERGTFEFSIPLKHEDDDDADRPSTVPEIVNHPEMGVNFQAWLERDPNQELSSSNSKRVAHQDLLMWWERNFYPNVFTIIKDLYSRGLLEEGDYLIDIDW